MSRKSKDKHLLDKSINKKIIPTMPTKTHPSLLAIYQTKDGALQLKTDATNETIWASLNEIATLFGRDKSVISRHINNIFREEELDEKMVVAFFATTTQHGAVKAYSF